MDVNYNFLFFMLKDEKILIKVSKPRVELSGAELLWTLWFFFFITKKQVKSSKIPFQKRTLPLKTIKLFS